MPLLSILLVPNTGPTSSNYFHVSMLSISLIVGVIYVAYLLYNYWYRSRSLLSFFGSLVLALLFRTFFTLLIVSIFIIERRNDDNWLNFLLVFQNFCKYWALAYWLLVTIYFHECIETDFNSEPNLKFFQFAIPGISTFYTLVWAFIMAGEAPSHNWLVSLVFDRAFGWILHTFELLYLLIQLGLFVNIGRMFLGKKDSYDSECFSLVRNSAFIMVALVIQRWILFGFTVGKGSSDEAYYFFRYFVEGLECAVACPLLFFLEKWGGQIFVKSPRSPKAAGGKIARRRQVPEEIVVGSQSRPISTIESVYAARVTRRMETETETRDVVYSSVLPSERLQKMFDMYKRMNVLPVDVTVVAGEEFYECRDDAATVYEDVILKESPTEIELPATKISRAPEHVKKRNALYASKYLVLNSKENKAPSFLGAPSKSSAADNGTVSPGVNKTDEIVAKWLSDNSKNLGKV